MKTIRFGIIGLGMMGREFASAAARWCHLTGAAARPELVAICSRSLAPEKTGWFSDNFPTIRQVTSDYRDLLANPAVEAVYVAIPHHLHAEVYCAAIRAGKHLLGEKPFGIDLAASQAILACMAEHPQVLVRCASQYLFYPAAQRILRLIEADAFGRIIELESGFLHSSDLNPDKPINWKRQVEFNGEYGVLGDLGVHAALIAFRAGWQARNTRAICSNIVPQRPDAQGRLVESATWDNATLLTELHDARHGAAFPWVLRAARIMPGERNTWYLAVHGTKASARFSLRNPKCLEWLRYENGEQNWQAVEMAFETAYPAISSATSFECGALDVFMQLMAAFMDELARGEALSPAAACPTPAETHACHRLFTAALRSHASNQAATLDGLA